MPKPTSPVRQGFTCPSCPPQKDGRAVIHRILFVYRTRKPCPSRIVHYRECRECGYRIVTEEHQTKVAIRCATPYNRRKSNSVPKKSA